MTGQELETVRERQALTLSTEQLRYIANTEFVPSSLRGNLPAILACVATGRELGIGDMQALKTIHIIDGKPTFSAELMVLLVRRAGHSITGNFSGGSCTVVGRRADNGDEMTVTWTAEMAAAAGLNKKQNWVKYEGAMLWARAVSQLCRMLFADCFAGATYTPDELSEGEVLQAQEADWSDDDGLFPPLDALEPGGAVSEPEPKADEKDPADSPSRGATQQVDAASGSLTADELERQLVAFADSQGRRGKVAEAVAESRGSRSPEEHLAWLVRARGKAVAAAGGEDAFVVTVAVPS